MFLIAISILILYTLAILFICLYSLIQLHLLIIYKKEKRSNKKVEKILYLKDLPLVTIQLPIYNELYVVERLIDNIIEMNYPKEKLEIQVLDDSSDETQSLIRKRVNFYKERGFDINHIQRKDRKGFKAGALDYGLKLAKGDLVAIFDADFLPNKDFLTQVIPYFNEDDMGMVQTRWSYLNKNYSLFTMLQAFGLNAHFSIEQVSRNTSNYFINFNGTAGIWRKACISEGGGWSDDTLTEDLDLSYRCQFKGWKMKYLENIESPAELPVSISAIKNQQYRWNKGAAETVRKHFKNIIGLPISLSQKIHAVFHLMGSTVFLSILTCALLSIPLLFIKYYFANLETYFNIITGAFFSFIILFFYYWYANKTNKKISSMKRIFQFSSQFFMFLAFSMGLSLQNGIAVIEGYIGRKTPFIRTPKFNITSEKCPWKTNKYVVSKIGRITYLEGFLSLYFFSGLYFAGIFQDYGLFLFHFTLCLGFGTIFFFSVVQSSPVISKTKTIAQKLKLIFLHL